MKHIAILTNLFYPIMDAPSAIIEKYLRLLSEDYKFHIIAKTYNINFTPSNDYDISYITSFRHRLCQKCLDNIENKRNVMISRFVLILLRICMIVQTQYSFPTERKWEVNAYFSQLESLYNNIPFDTVVAVSDNFVTQLAMLKFKKNHPNIKWISFIVDPYSELYIYYNYKLFKGLWKKANLRKEHAIYERANYCMFSVEMFKYVNDVFRIDNTKIFPIHFPLNSSLSGSNNCNNIICKLLYAGGFYKLIRNPEFALSTLSNVDDIQFDMYVPRGECEDIIKQYESDKIARYLWVDRNKYEDMLRNDYDILINIGNVSTLQAPSKMLELLSTGKPIINFCFSKDTQYEMIDKYPLGINIMNQDYDAVKKIDCFCKEFKGKILPFEKVEKLYPDNNLQKQVNLLKVLIDS